METKQSTFEQGLKKAESRLKRVERSVNHTLCMVQVGRMEDAYQSALTLACESERLTLLTRALPAYTGRPQAASTIEKLMLNTARVKIGFTAEGWFGVIIPALLPKKSEGSADYIRLLLYPAMRQFFCQKEPVQYPQCVLIFRHVYDRGRPERRYRDHDNIEVNMVADIVALYVMTDDAPPCCSHYYCSTAGDSDRTEVYVVPQSEFPQWLESEKSFPAEGVQLLENRP